MNTETTFDQWAIVEIMGRQVIAGRVTEQTIGGTAFIRVDVPEVDGQLGFTRFYGAGAIYAMTPVSEEVARIALKRFRPEPVTVYVPELKQLAAPKPAPEPHYEDVEYPDEDDYSDDDEDDLEGTCDGCGGGYGPGWSSCTCDHDRSESERCPVCGWPMADDPKNGCVPGNCSYRTE